MGKPENTIGALKYPGVDPKNAQKVVMGLVNNGELIKEAAPMIETLKNVVNGMNPPVPMAVGVQNLTGAIKSGASLGRKAKGEQEQADPCAIENRPNLTPEQLAECERLDAIEKGDYTEKDPEPAYSTSISDEWTKSAAENNDLSWDANTGLVYKADKVEKQYSIQDMTFDEYMDKFAR